jgi:serine/threonine protein kinase
MNPADPTATHAPQEPATSSEADWDAGLAAAFGLPQKQPHAPPPEPEVGAILDGKYRLTERIGEGGMGSVWVAQQTEPVRRRVAIKLIKAGMDSKSVLARFEAERQALAVMDHPNIAKVLDGGIAGEPGASATGGGRPYFVMELVKGVPITEYCDARKLTPRERLELFLPVCHAIQHAHQKGIIHRDIKPSNVLIALYDDLPVPKVIDFGVAKATGAALTEHTIETAFGGVIGTPQYMSPEQAQLNNLDIDTRSDVYSLGVLLYELLTGSPPFARQELEKRGLLELLRVVREVEPPKPSTKLSSAAALPTLAANRGTEPGKLTKLLRSELDWIVLKALEKDRSRRYETANGFAADINRYLAGEPVVAHPPSAGYRLRKFARKHRAELTTTAAIGLLLVAGVATSSWQAVRATRAETTARFAERDARQAQQAAAERAEGERLAKLQAQEQKAQAEAARDNQARERGYAEAIAEFVKDDFLALTSVEGQGRFGGQELTWNATLRELLDRAAEKLKDRKNLAPRTEAELCWIIGVSYRGVGEAARAIPFLERSVELQRKASGPEAEATVNARNSLAVAYAAAGQYDLALPLHKETLKLLKARLGPDHLNTLTSMDSLASAYRSAGKLERALPLFEETLRLRKAKLGPEHPHTLTSMGNVAGAYKDAGKLDLALPLYEETLRLSKAKLGPDHPTTLISMGNLAGAYHDVGKLDLAVPLFEESLKLTKARFGPEHPTTLNSMGNLAMAYQDSGKRDLAMPLHEETLRLRKVKLGPEHRLTLISMNNLASAYQDAGKLELAVPLHEETLKLKKAKLGPDHPDTLGSMNNLAMAYQAAGKLDLALPLHEETLKLIRAKLGSDHPTTLASMGNLGKAYCVANQGEKAVATLKEFVAARRKRSKPDDPQFAGLLALVALELFKCRQHAAIEEMLRECLAIREKTEPDSWTTFNTKSMLGGALLGQRKYADAEPLLLAGYEGIKHREKTIPTQGKVRIPEALDRLIELYTETSKPDEAKKWQAERAKYPVMAPQPRDKR